MLELLIWLCSGVLIKLHCKGSSEGPLLEMGKGIHLDPSIYLMDDKNKSPSASPAIGKEKGSEKSKNGIPAQKNHSDPCGRQPEKNSCPQVGSAGKTESAMDMVSDSLKSVDISGNTPNDEGGTVKASDAIEDLLNKKDKAGTESSDEE
ncbi:uncharacterized protein [Primulina eburnea]|uniref:uncharacterized protein isoform X3 n=1 Tax=Primulina eburnea TaxID=1245227 RepID=UPI003C6CC01F